MVKPAKLGLPPETMRDESPTSETIWAVFWVPVPSIVRTTSFMGGQIGAHDLPPLRGLKRRLVGPLVGEQTGQLGKVDDAATSLRQHLRCPSLIGGQSGERDVTSSERAHLRVRATIPAPFPGGHARQIEHTTCPVASSVFVEMPPL